MGHADSHANGGGQVAVAYSTKLHNTQSNQAGKVYEEYTVGLDRSSPPPTLLTAMQVRRLTPRECERLQGFPDDYTLIPMRGKPAADGPRYKALGNSWAVPNVRWIGERIDAVNPCKQVRRNKERPRKKAPLTETLQTFLAWAWQQKGQGAILAGMAEFASLAGNRGIEFRELTWPQVGELVTRLIRAKQRGGETEQIVEEVEMSAMLHDLMDRLRVLAKDSRHGWVFPNAKGNAYTAQAFKLGFNRLKKAARKAGVLTVELNFTFHDLRAYFVTQFKKKHGKLPDLHKNPATTAQIYDSSSVVSRKSL